MPSKKSRAKSKKAAQVRHIKSNKECQESHKVCQDKEYERMQMKALDNFLEKHKELTDESGYKKYCMRVMIQHTNLLGRNFPKHDSRFNGRSELPKEIVEGLDISGSQSYGKPIKTLGFWNIVNGDVEKTSDKKEIEYMYASYDNGAIMPIGKKSQEFPIKMEW